MKTKAELEAIEVQVEELKRSLQSSRLILGGGGDFLDGWCELRRALPTRGGASLGTLGDGEDTKVGSNEPSMKCLMRWW